MDPCSRALRQLQRNEPDKFVQALDAFGKPPAGVMEGNMAWVGDYDECLSIPDLKYCSINMKLNASTLDPPSILQLVYGVCVPEVCTPELIVRKIDSIMSLIPSLSFIELSSPMFGNYPVNCQEFPQRQYDAGFICFTVFCALLLLIVILGTALDIFQSNKQSKQNDSYCIIDDTKEQKDSGFVDEERSSLLHRNNSYTSSTNELKCQADSKPSTFRQVLLCFSFKKNVSALLDAKQISDRSIQCLNGIRVISLTWIVLGHTYTFNLMTGADNAAYVFDVIKRFGFQAIANAYSAVDTFFFMSGFLISYLTLSRMEAKNGKLLLGLFYFHRIWRLLPLYAVVILFTIYYFPYFGSGPFWYIAMFQSQLCAKYWWRNLLFINNFFPIEEMCMDWSWYLSNEMQFYIISPLILIPLYRIPAIGFVLLSLCLTASLMVTVALIASYDLNANPYGVIFGMDPGVQFGNYTFQAVNYLSIVYIKPYSRVVPYLIGIVFGYFIYKQIKENRRIRLSLITVILGWLLAFGVGIAVVYGTYGSYAKEPFHSSWSMAQNISYGTLYRLAWSLALVWVLFACYYGYGGWISAFLSWYFWIPLSRLTYSAYLIHGVVVMLYFQGSPKPHHVSLMTNSYIFCGSLLLSYAAAALFSLLIEYPLAGLEKIATGRKTANI